MQFKKLCTIINHDFGLLLVLTLQRYIIT